MIHELLAESHGRRRRAVRDLPRSPALPFALRRVLFTDRHAEVRAAAARRLGQLDDPRAAAWLADALGDGSGLVRDAILRALARGSGEAGIVERVRAHVTEDRMWWVRRTAIYTLAALAGAAELPAFEAALADPFWRVRHAAVKVLAALGARDLEVRARIHGDGAAAETLAFLRGSWGPALVEAPQRASTPTQLPPALLDPDPAVVTARLAAEPSLASPLALVELLCDPHAPLRLLAAELVANSGDLAAYEAALDWLEEPRIPHVADTVEHLLDGLGDPAAAIAERALARTDRPGAARWAIAWIVATRYTPLAEAARARARADARVRGHALPLATTDELVAWARAASLESGLRPEDPTHPTATPLVGADARLTEPIAAELHRRRAFAALASLATAASPRARTLQVEAAARAGRWDDVARALTDPHHGPRAAAAWLLQRDGRDVTAARTDEDPAVREAAGATLADPDPWVARAAVRMLASDPHAAPPEAIDQALASPDAWIRAEACRLPIAGDATLARVLALVADPDEAVRAAALAALGAVPDVDARIASLVVDGDAHRIARAWLHGEQPPRAEPAPRARITTTTTSTPARRAFGRLGFEVAPLVISGAYELSPGALAHAEAAGVDLWFWEPSYHGMTRFLRRRPAARVITGSYHAEPHAILADIERACRKLRRDTLDVFLLFWTRSPARVDAAAFATLDAIRRSGKIRALGFSTHDRALARSAIEASPWDVVMIRHSAAHPGIERELLPTARARGTAILTFSALCYGRMTSGPGAPTDVECIRYSLSQPGVTACINAPRRRAEVEARVAVLAAPALPDERVAAMREHGLGVRAESQRFNTLMRQPTRDAAAAARELLASELPPRDELEQRPLPRPRAARASRTHLGKTRRRSV